MSRDLRFAALSAALLLLGACASPSTVASSTPKPAKSAPVVATQKSANGGKCVGGATNEPLSSFSPAKMIGETVGWAIGSCTLGTKPSFPNGSTLNCYAAQGNWMGIERTSDGGATWRDVSPPSVANRTWHHAQFFLDNSHAWVEEVSRNADACASQAITFITNDGGTTWRQGGAVALKLSSPEDDVFNVGLVDNMDFIDPGHGWLTVTSAPSHPNGGPGDMTMLTLLYSTSDGGTHWRLVATNPGRSLLAAAGCPPGIYQPGSDPVFVSQTTGWLALACPPGVLMLTTRDGGVTWSPRPFPNCTCQVYIARVFDANHVTVTGGQGSPAMLVTSDGGATWVQRQVPAAATTDFSFIDPDHGWMVGISQLPTSYQTVVYRTTDGGQNWALISKPTFGTVSSNPKAYFPVTGVRFVNNEVGFVQVGSEEAGVNGQIDPSMPTLQILRTNDGGGTWSVVLKQVPENSCTADYRTIGFGDGGLQPVKMSSPTVGWALGGLRTTDGGLHWRDVSSSALREGSATTLYPPVYTDFYLDGNHAWQAAVYGSRSTCEDHVTTFATTDGGKTWQQSQPIAIHLQAGEGVGRLQMGFTGARSGWLLVPTGPRSLDPFDFRPDETTLYMTSDGGLTWRNAASLTSSALKGIAPPSDSQNCPMVPGQAVFSSPTTGWLSLNCSTVSMLVTHDSGATWKPASFPVPGSVQCPCYIDIPQFVNQSRGIVLVSGDAGVTASNVLLTTADGGTTWRQAGQPGTGFVVVITYADPNDLFALVTPPGWTKLSPNGFELYRSSDGGSTWSMVASKVPASWPPGFLGFADLNHGFESNVNGATEILVTTDGGRTWKSITPSIVS